MIDYTGLYWYNGFLFGACFILCIFILIELNKISLING